MSRCPYSWLSSSSFSRAQSCQAWGFIRPLSCLAGADKGLSGSVRKTTGSAHDDLLTQITGPWNRLPGPGAGMAGLLAKHSNPRCCCA